MTDASSKITIHMVSSLDGFIEAPDGDVSWMSNPDHFDGGKVLKESDIEEYLKKIDCYVMGSKTYEQALQLGWPYGEKPVYVFTSRSLSSDNPKVKFLSGNLKQEIQVLIETGFKNIWMVGGAKLTREFLLQGIAEEIVISVMPVILGGGIPFFDNIGKEINLQLTELEVYRDGMVEITYQILKTKNP